MAHLHIKLLMSHFQEHEDGLVLHADVSILFSSFYFVKGELWSILTLSSFFFFFVNLECCQYREQQKSLCYPLFKICTLLTGVLL